MTVEKRRFSRISFDVRARLRVAETEYNVDKIVNLSAGGCLLVVQGGFSVGDLCTVVILLDRMAPGVDVGGEIVRTAEGEVSVQFTSVTPENLMHLQNIIRYNAEDPEKIEEEFSARKGLQ